MRAPALGRARRTRAAAGRARVLARRAVKVVLLHAEAADCTVTSLAITTSSRAEDEAAPCTASCCATIPIAARRARCAPARAPGARTSHRPVQPSPSAASGAPASAADAPARRRPRGRARKEADKVVGRTSSPHAAREREARRVRRGERLERGAVDRARFTASVTPRSSRRPSRGSRRRPARRASRPGASAGARPRAHRARERRRARPPRRRPSRRARGGLRAARTRVDDGRLAAAAPTP